MRTDLPLLTSLPEIPYKPQQSLVSMLRKMHRSQDLDGTVLRTLAYYLAHPNSITRSEDIELVLALSVVAAEKR